MGARNSPLSKVQVEEVYKELQQFYPGIKFQLVLVKTRGDNDKKTSLRDFDKTDFFTREIDQMQLSGECRIGIHSAKDLPNPLPAGLVIAALTAGVDKADSLVLRENTRLESLPQNAKIATSSVRREKNVKKLRADLTFVDIRGTIGERLQKLENKEVDGVVIAEAALIRLNLIHLNRVRLPGRGAPLQGKLAVIAREDDQEICTLFQVINERKNKKK